MKKILDKIYDQISLLINQYVCYIISLCDIDTLSTMHVVGVTTLITLLKQK